MQGLIFGSRIYNLVSESLTHAIVFKINNDILQVVSKTVIFCGTSRYITGIENRIYREELKESLGMNFFQSLSA